MGKQSEAPSLEFYDSMQEKILGDRLSIIRKVLDSSGEKGRALEGEVMRLLRVFLPSEYGLGTGFVAYRSGDETHLSSQLDIIIFDALRCAPLVVLETCEIYPLEAVYGYVEVKASLCSSDAAELPHYSIEACMLKNAPLREMEECHYCLPGATSTSALTVSRRRLRIRSYLFAFTSTVRGNDPAYFAQRMADATKSAGHTAHMHGVFVGDLGFFRTLPVRDPGNNPDFQSAQYWPDRALGRFKWGMLLDLARFERFPVNETPALDLYQPMPMDCKPVRPSI